MALIKFGGGITGMSGSMGGNTFARNRYGNYLRNRTKPVNPNSSAQQKIRSALAELSEMWHDTLTLVMRTAWNAYGNAVAMKNRIGETTYLTGFNHFLRSNIPRVQSTYAFIQAGPTTLALPEKDTVWSLVADQATNKLTITYDGTLPWKTEANAHLMVWCGEPQLGTHNFFNGPWKYAGYIDQAAANPIVMSAPYVLTVNQKVWIYGRVLRADGRISEKFFCSDIVG
jgi:hypothetical protein